MASSPSFGPRGASTSGTSWRSRSSPIANTHIEGDGMVYQGLRFRVQGQLAGKAYGVPFGLDVGFGDVLTEPPEMIDGTDFLDFVGVQRARHRVYPCVVHIAEKLHAYTLPRKRENSRVKDLPDIALLAQVGTPWRTLAELLVAVRTFIDPVLEGATGTWDPERWTW
jgi:hypothetical protein